MSARSEEQRLSTAVLGWGSAALTSALQAAQQRSEPQANADSLDWLSTIQPRPLEASTATDPLPHPPNQASAAISGCPTASLTLAIPTATPRHHSARPAQIGHLNLVNQPAGEDATVQEQDPIPTRLRHFPTIGVAMLRQEVTATGRLWLLCRALDAKGQGCLPLERLRQQLTEKESPLRLCGKRRLRQLLREGESLFWRRDKERLWLAGAAAVAQRLGIERLAGSPVWLSIDSLLGPIADVRAELYAAFHGGRKSDAPISRAALQKASGVKSRTQQRYEQRAGVRVESHFAIGSSFSKERQEKMLWQRGQGFIYTDKRGRFGPAGQRYLAWRLPNSYQSKHQTAAAGRQRKHNRRIDLVTRRAQGNGRRCFFSQAAAAWKAAVVAKRVCYWSSGRAGIWLAAG